MAKSAPDKVVLKGDPIYKELPLEALDVYGVGAITPGFLCERTATNTVQPHSTADGQASPLFAVEGLNFTANAVDAGTIDDDYDTDDQAVLLAYSKPGDEIYALLAAGEDTTGAGVLLASNCDGALKVSSTNPVARSLEDVDNDPGTGGAAVRVKVEVL